MVKNKSRHTTRRNRKSNRNKKTLKKMKKTKIRRKTMRGGVRPDNSNNVQIESRFIMNDVIEIPGDSPVSIYTLDTLRNSESLEHGVIFEIVEPADLITARVVFRDALMIDSTTRYYGAVVMNVENQDSDLNVGDLIYFPMGTELDFYRRPRDEANILFSDDSGNESE
tara:strand:- start:775 stop:1278 length:504 start_codon:yes stop_codon:yes gene_type:complete